MKEALPEIKSKNADKKTNGSPYDRRSSMEETF